MAIRTLRLALVLSCFYFAFCKADAGKPYHIKKSSLCFSDQNSEVCKSDKYNFYAVVQQVVDNVNKLSKKEKGIGGDSGVCANALKKSMCSKPSPLCFDGNDDSGAKRVCDELRRECPFLVGDSFDKYEDECVKYMQKEFTNLTCVRIGADEKFKGYCPKPSGKMPAAYWRAYKEKSDKLEDPMGYLETVNKITGVNLVSDDCMKKIKDAVCVPLYCTEDEKSIIVPNLQDKCNDVLKCINKVSDKYTKLSAILKPIKDYLNGGCDKIVEAIRAAGASSSSSNDACSMSQGFGLELFLITITLLVTYFY